ncbi:MAG: hypothetical protein ACE5ET_01540 [Gammaproteobacteria bacterium]
MSPHKRRWPIAILALLILQHIPAYGFSHGEFLIFPNINSLSRDKAIDLAGHHSLPKDRTEPTVDFFYSQDFKRLRLISEFFVSSSKNHGSHFERLQIGWRLQPAVELWAGRFHNPLGYWNTQYHHGNYLETAISRPGIVSYEHDGGILPMHVVGLHLTGDIKRGEGVFGYDLGVGLGPKLTEHDLAAMDIIDHESSHEPVTTLRLRYQPLEDGPDQYGVFLSRATITSTSIGDVEQTIAGAYINWERERLRLISALYSINNDFARNDDNHFVNGYLQLEFPLASRWTLFARAEGGKGENGDAYLEELPAFVRERQLGGLRFEFHEYQALKVEISNNRYLGNYGEQIQLQWSAVLP